MAATTSMPNDFRIEHDLSLVTVAPAPTGTTFQWDQYYDHVDLPAMRAAFDDGFADMTDRVIARFGGRVVERWIDGPRNSP